MNILEKVIGGGVSSLVDSVTNLIGKFVQSPEEKAKILVELEALRVSESQTITEAASRAVETEAKSEDPWVRRSRPTFLYIMYLIIVWNFMLLPLCQFFTGHQISLIELPENLYWLFGSGFLGYVGARSWDKMKNGFSKNGNNTSS